MNPLEWGWWPWRRARQSMSAMTIIAETPRLILGRFDATDLDALAALMANPDVMRFSLGVYSREQSLSLLERLIADNKANRPTLYAAMHRADEKLIGYCGFLRQKVGEKDELEIGYRFHPDYWNQGIATEAARAVRDYGFDRLGLDHLVSFIHLDNHASRRVAEKNGMQLETEITFRGYPTQVFGISRTVQTRN
jgi:ribosomal-protein-alanine N-acetyltransferase